MSTDNKKFYQGTNFLVSLALIVFSVWSGFNTETGERITELVLGAFGGVFAIRQMIKDSIPDFGKWISSGNTWTYLTALIASVFGDNLAELIPGLQSVVEAVSAGNFQAILSAGVAFLVSVYYFWRDNRPEEIPAAA